MEFKSITNEPRINLDSENRAFSVISSKIENIILFLSQNASLEYSCIYSN